MRNLRPPRNRGPAPTREEKDFVAVTARAGHEGLRLDWRRPDLPALDTTLGAVSSGTSGSLPSKSASSRRVVPQGASPSLAGRLKAVSGEAGRQVLLTPGPAQASSLCPSRVAGSCRVSCPTGTPENDTLEHPESYLRFSLKLLFPKRGPKPQKRERIQDSQQVVGKPGEVGGPLWLGLLAPRSGVVAAVASE